AGVPHRRVERVDDAPDHGVRAEVHLAGAHILAQPGALRVGDGGEDLGAAQVHRAEEPARHRRTPSAARWPATAASYSAMYFGAASRQEKSRVMPRWTMPRHRSPSR